MRRVIALLAFASACAKAGPLFLHYDGLSGYAEVPSDLAFSVSDAGLTVAAWMRPDSLSLQRSEGLDAGEPYAHWMGKGDEGNAEWAFRFYGDVGTRASRISFYVFQSGTRLGCGSYFQDPIAAGEWIHVVGVVDASARQTAIFKNGELRHSDSYASLTLSAGGDPLRIGTRDLASFFPGAVREVEIWGRPLSAAEVQTVFHGGPVPGVLARYPLDEGSGQIVHDVAGGRHGRIVSGSWQPAAGGPVSASGSSGGGC